MTAARILSAIFLLWQAASPPTRLSEPASVAGTTVGVGGERLRYQYHFDHNALRQAIRIGPSIVTLTESGNLLRFDASTLEFTGQYVVVDRGTAVAADNGSGLLLGTADGQVDRVDVTTWGRASIAKVSGPITWLAAATVSGQPAVIAVVGAPFAPGAWPGEKRTESERRIKKSPPSSVVMFGEKSRRPIPLTNRESMGFASFAVDRSGGLWVGTNFGEFGGSLARIDLVTGLRRDFKFTENTRGFARGEDGTIIAYGGVAHFSIARGFVARLDPGGPTLLKAFTNDAPQAPSSPAGPIDLMSAASDGGWWAVSNHIVYRVDLGASVWIQRASLGGRWLAGASFAIANTQTATGILADPREPNEAIGVMGRDGLVHITRAGEVPRAFDRQLETSPTHIWKTSIGMILVGSPSESAVWRREGDAWVERSLMPPAHNGVADNWLQCDIAGDDGKGVVSVCETNITPGPRAITRLRADGTTEVLESWRGSSYSYNGLFLVPGFGPAGVVDGEIWTAHGGATSTVGHSTRPFGWDRQYWPSIGSFEPLGETGAGTFFFDARFGEIMRLDRPVAGSWTLEVARGSRGRFPEHIMDVAPDLDGWTLGATPEGLVRFHVPDGEQRRIASPNSREVFMTLARDGRGRLWTAGNDLYCSEDEGAHWTRVELPVAGPAFIKRVRANPQSANGVWISISGRGLVIISS